MILEKLRSHTSAVHKRLEESSAISKISNKSLSLNEYISLLKRFYGFIMPMEKNLFSINGIMDVVPDLLQRSKTPLLLEDLNYLDSSIEIESIEVCNDLPSLTDINNALGYLYVIEGSTLGGKLLSKTLKDSLDLAKNGGCSYFVSYDEERGLMWKQFLKYLSEYSSASTNNLKIVATAEEVFLKLELWINK